MKFFIGILFALTGIVVGSANAMTASRSVAESRRIELRHLIKRLKKNVRGFLAMQKTFVQRK